MSERLIIFCSFCLALFGSTTAQSIQVLSRGSSQPVNGVVLNVTSIASGKTRVVVTNKNGEVDIEGSSFPIVLSAHHVNYELVSDTLWEFGAALYVNPKMVLLDNIVVTGQYSPQSTENSIYPVKIINAKMIRNQGATKITDVLEKQLNIRISPDVAIGSSGMSLQGIHGNNVKILVDGVPLVNRNGNGNDADLNQINVANIERIEIVEGPMAVSYGANALAGVINIINKKVKEGEYRLSAAGQGETISNDYGLHAGSSNFNITSGYALSKSVLLSVNGALSRFGGFYGYNDGRAYLWNPKDQYVYDANLTYKTVKNTLTYKFENFHEKIDDLGNRKEEVHQATGTIRPFGIDAEFISKRYSHQIQAKGKFSNFNRYNLIFSHTNFTRKKRTFKNYLDNFEEINFTTSESSDTTNYEAFVARGIFLHVDRNTFVNYQVGFEVNSESTSGGRIAGIHGQSMQDYAAFFSFEMKPLDGLKIRSGLRGTVNSVFNGSLIPSINLKYKVGTSLSFNAAYGRGYRTPSLRELYFEFIDTNHNIIGNEKLTPELSNHYDIGITHRWTKNIIGLKSTLTFFHNDITNLIGLGVDPTNQSINRFFNVGELKTLGGNLEEIFMYGHLTIGLGVGITGRKEKDLVGVANKFFYSPEMRAEFNYLERISGINISLFYKFNGKSSRYFINQNSEAAIGSTDGYALLDMTLHREIVKNTTLTIGAKNLFDVTSVNNSFGNGSMHSGGDSSTTTGTGRSWLFRLAYNFNSNH